MVHFGKYWQSFWETNLCFFSAAFGRLSDPGGLHRWDPQHLQSGHFWQQWGWFRLGPFMMMLHWLWSWPVYIFVLHCSGLDMDLTTLLVWLAKNRSIRHLSLGKNFNNIKSKWVKNVQLNIPEGLDPSWIALFLKKESIKWHRTTERVLIILFYECHVNCLVT